MKDFIVQFPWLRIILKCERKTNWNLSKFTQFQFEVSTPTTRFSQCSTYNNIMNYTQWEAQQMQSVRRAAEQQSNVRPKSRPKLTPVSPVPSAQCPIWLAGESLSGWAAAAVITLCHTRDNGGRKWKWGVPKMAGRRACARERGRGRFFSDCCCMTLASEICFVAARFKYCYYL